MTGYSHANQMWIRGCRKLVIFTLLASMLTGPLVGLTPRRARAGLSEGEPNAARPSRSVYSEGVAESGGSSRPAMPSLAVTPDHAYVGQTVQVSGQGDPAYLGMRLAWMLGGATQTAAVLPVDGGGAYQTALHVPADAPVGAVQVCAALSGTERTAFECVDFTVDVPLPGRVQGQIALSDPGAPVEAQFNLIDFAGEQVASAQIQPDGSFDLSNVPPGEYEGSVSGVLADMAESGIVKVMPGGNTIVNPNKLVIPCTYVHVAAVTSILVNPGEQTGLYNPSEGKIIGTYLSLGASGQAVNVGFTPLIQVSPGTTLTKVEFYLVKPDGSQTLFASDTQGPIWQASYNASLLPPGFNKIIVKPYASEGCALENRVRLWVLPNPMADPLLRDTQVSFDYVQKRYHFSATVPNAGGVLPIRYPDPPPSIPLIGELENKLDAGVRFEGYLTMKGYVSMTLMRTDVLVRVLSQDIYNDSDHWINGEVPIGKYPQAVYYTPQFTLVNIHEKIPVYSGPVVSFLGIVTLNASVSIGFNGSVKMWVNLKPIEPRASSKLYPSVSPYLPISLWLTFIGIGIASMTGTTQITFGIPLAIDTKASPAVSLDDPCVHLRFWLEVWIGIDTYYFGKATLYEDTYDIFDETWGGCPALSGALQQARSQPRIMAQPVVASGPADTMLSVYIEDATPEADTTTPVVVGRFWNPVTQTWSEPSQISDGSYYVAEPSATYLGTDGQAIAAWMQNTLTRDEGAELGTDLSAILSHQEIFYAIWNGDSWSAPQQLTSDNTADANPSIAGDAAGASTLAWVKDTDGNIATRSDLEIVISELSSLTAGNPGGALAWGAPQLLSRLLQAGAMAPADEYMDAQPGVIRTGDPDMPAAITWTRDLDGEPATNGDRSVTVAMWGRDGWMENPLQDPPTGTDSPAIGWDADLNLLYMAFLRRGVDGDGVTETGIGDQARLWSAQWTAAGGWENLMQLSDAAGSPVRAEAPRLQVQSDVEALLLFRRFDDPGTPGMFGSLALSRRTPGSAFSPPLYLRSAAEHNWMQSMALDSSGQAMLLSVQRLFTPIEAAATVTSLSAAHELASSRLSISSDPVEATLLTSEADPALDPILALSQEHALPGSEVTITATLRNVGREPASGLVVSLYSGEPGSGVLLDSADLPEALEFNASLPILFVIPTTGGSQPLYAEVTTSGGDASAANNQAIGDLGALPSPSTLTIQEDSLHPNALQVSWMPSPVSGEVSYRILRAETPGGPYELVGEAQATLYTDLLLERGTVYYYVVQAEDAFGVRSIFSEEASFELAMRKVFLPAIVNR